MEKLVASSDRMKSLREEKFEHIGNSLMYFSPHTKTHDGAKQACASVGTHLVEAPTEEEFQEVIHLC